MKKVGYEVEKKKLLLSRTEKLAIAYGLMNTKSGETIRVIKNTRVCSDCHTAAKYMSLVRKREIFPEDGEGGLQNASTGSDGAKIKADGVRTSPQLVKFKVNAPCNNSESYTELTRVGMPAGCDYTTEAPLRVLINLCGVFSLNSTTLKLYTKE
ncbi:unnamed protein product [Malus baccata var. baccata]